MENLHSTTTFFEINFMLIAKFTFERLKPHCLYCYCLIASIVASPVPSHLTKGHKLLFISLPFYDLVFHFHRKTFLS